MKKTARYALALITALLLLPLNGFSQDIPDVYEIVNTIDKLYRSKTSRGELEMTIVTENWTRTLGMEVWTEELDKTFISITGPKRDAGISTLRIENEMWNYFPKINKVMKVPPSMMMSSWMGSDFTNDDLVKESSMTRDYSAKLITPDNPDPNNYYIELIPREDIPSIWARILLVVRKKDYIPVQQDYYDEKGRKMRVMQFKDIKTFGDRSIPSVLEMIPLNKKNKKTVITYSDIEFDIQLKPDVFTLRNLQKKDRK
jgi:outer membrane lipoprotein-sorting protein